MLILIGHDNMLEMENKLTKSKNSFSKMFQKSSATEALNKVSMW